MYSKEFCKIFNEFGWNSLPETFGKQLLTWIEREGITVKSSLDLACGTGVLCEILHKNGIEAAGMDFSEAMIAIAKEANPEISYEVADMIQYRPEKSFDLVTSTGDSINHIMDLKDVEQIFKNVYAYLNPGGHFIFDLLKEKEILPGEPIDVELNDGVNAQFQVTQDQKGVIYLNTTVFEEGKEPFEEKIAEIVHDREIICSLLEKSGFEVLRCADQLLEDIENHGTAWLVVAKKAD